MDNWLERTELLLGAEKLAQLKAAHVLVVGLGGVGAYAAEMIARAGVGRMTIADADVVNTTNINRQLVALHSTVGRPKAEVLAGRLRDINPGIELTVVAKYIRDEETYTLLDAADQTEYIKQAGFDTYYIIGGEGAVSKDVENTAGKMGKTQRIFLEVYNPNSFHIFAIVNDSSLPSRIT